MALGDGVAVGLDSGVDDGNGVAVGLGDGGGAVATGAGVEEGCGRGVDEGEGVDVDDGCPVAVAGGSVGLACAVAVGMAVSTSTPNGGVGKGKTVAMTRTGRERVSPGGSGWWDREAGVAAEASAEDGCGAPSSARRIMSVLAVARTMPVLHLVDCVRAWPGSVA